MSSEVHHAIAHHYSLLKRSIVATLLILGARIGYAEPAVANWTQITEHADWPPRDSQGAMVFGDRMWILGGWFDSNSPPPRDVWSSSDGKNWKLAVREAPWLHSDFPMAISHEGKMWMMGGWHNGRLPEASASNAVWSSEDGSNWKKETANAAWSPRVGAGIVSFKGKLWILGGTEQYYTGSQQNLKNDVWSSSDGRRWTQVASSTPWAPRAFLQAVVFENKLYIIGGGNYSPFYKAFNDVWSSSDGEHWECVTPNAEWHPRIWFSLLVYRNKMWVLGGWSNRPSQNWGDTWYSNDGKHWEQLQTKDGWIARHAQAAFVFKDAIWIAGGMIWPLTNEVWRLSLPTDWNGG